MADKIHYRPPARTANRPPVRAAKPEKGINYGTEFEDCCKKKLEDLANILDSAKDENRAKGARVLRDWKKDMAFEANSWLTGSDGKTLHMALLYLKTETLKALHRIASDHAAVHQIPMIAFYATYDIARKRPELRDKKKLKEKNICAVDKKYADVESLRGMMWDGSFWEELTKKFQWHLDRRVPIGESGGYHDPDYEFGLI